MSNRISELPVASEAIAGNDIVAVTNVSQPGTGETQKFNWLEMQNGGWINITDTWTYASATTITVPAGAASIYSVGDKIRFKQGGAYKYFYVVDVASTLLTVTGGSDFTVANATLTDNYYSKASTPVGFPQWFNLGIPTWTASGTAFTNQPTNNLWKFSLNGKTVIVSGQSRCHATSGGTGTFTATWAAGLLPRRLVTSVGASMNFNTISYGLCYNDNFDIIVLAKYDGTTLATNSEFFGAVIQFQI
jgi:hypothetical protein